MQRNKLKIEDLAENIKIKYIIEKVENDLHITAKFINSIRELETGAN